MTDRPLCRHCGPHGAPPKVEGDPRDIYRITLDDRHRDTDKRMSTAEVQAMTVAACAVVFIVGAFAAMVLALCAAEPATVEPSPLESDPDRPPHAAPDEPRPLHADVARGRCACGVAIAWGASDKALETCDLVVDEALLAGVDPVTAVAMGYHESRLDWRRANSSTCCGALQVKATYDDRPTCMELVGDPRLGVRTGLEIFRRYGMDLMAYNAGPRGASLGRGKGYAAQVLRYREQMQEVCDG